MNRQLLTRGMTLIELLLALTLGLLVTAAAWQGLRLGRQALASLEQQQQLQDQLRLSRDWLPRLLRQLDARTPVADGLPIVYGWDDAAYRNPGSARRFSDISSIRSGNRPAACGKITDSSCRNGSDILALRYHGADGPAGVGSDGGIMSCNGSVLGAGNEGYAFLYINRHSVTGEPQLSCAYLSAGGQFTSTGLIPGVESLQLLYGLADGTSPAQITEWHTASELELPGDRAASEARWLRVRAIRIGLVLRSSINPAQTSLAQTVYPLGQAHATQHPADSGASLRLPADRRQRRLLQLQFHLGTT